MVDADAGDAAGKEREDEHTHHVRQGDGNGHHAAGVGVTAAANQSAAADDGGADSGHKDNRAKGATGNKEVAGTLNVFGEIKADEEHADEVRKYNDDVKQGYSFHGQISPILFIFT